MSFQYLPKTSHSSSPSASANSSTAELNGGKFALASNNGQILPSFSSTAQQDHFILRHNNIASSVNKYYPNSPASSSTYSPAAYHSIYSAFADNSAIPLASAMTSSIPMIGNVNKNYNNYDNNIDNSSHNLRFANDRFSHCKPVGDDGNCSVKMMLNAGSYNNCVPTTIQESHSTMAIPSTVNVNSTTFSESRKNLLDLPSSFSEFSLVSPLYGTASANVCNGHAADALYSHPKLASTSAVISSPANTAYQHAHHPDQRLMNVANEIVQTLNSKANAPPVNTSSTPTSSPLLQISPPRPTSDPVDNYGYAQESSFNRSTGINTCHGNLASSQNGGSSVGSSSISSTNLKDTIFDPPISNEQLQRRKFQNPLRRKPKRYTNSHSNSSSSSKSSSKNNKPPTRCHSCNCTETPEWRRGPDGARTLCNACGLHYAKLLKKKQQSWLDLTSRIPPASKNNAIRLLSLAATSSLEHLKQQSDYSHSSSTASIQNYRPSL